MKGVKLRCLSDSSTVLCLQFVLIYASSNKFNFINKNSLKIVGSWSIRNIYFEKELIFQAQTVSYIWQTNSFLM